MQSLVAYFRGTYGEMAFEPQVLLEPEGRKIRISKVKRRGSALVALALPTGALIGHGNDQLTELLAGAVKTKAYKLRSVARPWVLVILDQYGFQQGIQEWRTRLPPESSDFAAIVRVYNKKAELISGNLWNG